MPAAAPKIDGTTDLTQIYPPCPRPAPEIQAKDPKPVPLPAEMILSILEAAYYTPTLEPDTDLLLACSVVCKAWAAPAQTLLFQSIILRSQRAYIAFSEAVDRSTERGRALSQCVHSLRAIIDPSQPFRLLPRSFARAATLCPNLQEIDLSLYGARVIESEASEYPLSLERSKAPTSSFDATTLSLLRAGPAITSLRFSNWSENADALPQLLSIWPSLQSLTLRGLPPLMSEPPAQAALFPSALHTLHLNLQPAPSPEFLDWLLHTTRSASSLRSLELARQPDPRVLEKLLTAHGSTLTSLALPAIRSAELSMVTSACPHLAALRIEHPWAGPAIFRRAPKELSRIALGIDEGTPLGPVLDLVRSREAVSAVTVLVWRTGENHPQVEDLRRLCVSKGVEIRVVKNVEQFRALVRADPAPCSTVLDHHNDVAPTSVEC